MHRKLPQVVSAITGVTGMAILKAIIAGERAPQRLAKLRTPHCHPDADDIAKALQGLNIAKLSYTATCRVPAGAKLHILF